MNTFIFIVPFYNAGIFITDCVKSLQVQSYTNWHAVLINDASTDNTLEHIPSDQRIKLITNQNRQTALPNIHHAIVTAGLGDDDVICILDGDDMLLRTNVCYMLDNIYKRHSPLVTYGQYITSQGLIGHCHPYTQQSFELEKRTRFVASHLKTFKYKVYRELLAQDPLLSCYKNNDGSIYTMSCDVAIMTPLLEIVGLNKVFFNPMPIYYYRIHEKNDHVINFNLQTNCAREIFSKPPFQQIF